MSESGNDSALASFRQHQSHAPPASPQRPPSSAANVSGLVCNVHRTTGQEPPPLIGATSTIVGDKLFVFGGRKYSRTRTVFTADLYELDLLRRHWTKIEPVGEIPSPRYFHSVCALGDTKLICYGGTSPAPTRPISTGTSQSDSQPELAVMADLHMYDIQSRRWVKIHPSSPEQPQGRYAHCATILPSSAVFTSADAPTTALQHNLPSRDPHSGTLGVHIDGTGGAEMVIIGGQDKSNNYIEQISVFNLRSLKWTSSIPYDGKCGAYKNMIVPLPNIRAQAIGSGGSVEDTGHEQNGTAMLIYFNHNFTDVRTEVQIRMPNGQIVEKQMTGPSSPPGLRFPNGGVINGHFVVSGTYLTASKHEYALWTLDLKTLTWAQIDTAGTVFGQGSWNRGLLWNRRNTYVILGHRKRDPVEDYNHRRVNFAHVCTVELEAFGLYESPRKSAPNSAYISNSAPGLPSPFQLSLTSKIAAGRPISSIAEQLGHTALQIPELSDMVIVALHGECIPCNSHILRQRWGPYFQRLMLDAVQSTDGPTAVDSNSLQPIVGGSGGGKLNNRNRSSVLTITPGTNGASAVSPPLQKVSTDADRKASRALIDLPDSTTIPAASRQRQLYLPHTVATIRLMLRYIYTSTLPPLSDPLCSPHTLCSLLQMARPYQIDGLQEATLEKLHEVLDGRHAAAIFNAAAMAAGGGRATDPLAMKQADTGDATGIGSITTALDATALKQQQTQIHRSEKERGRGDEAEGEQSDAETETSGTESTIHTDDGETSGAENESARNFSSTTTNNSNSKNGNQRDAGTSAGAGAGAAGAGGGETKIWTGDISSVIGLQKRGLRGLMEGRILREKAGQGESQGS